MKLNHVLRFFWFLPFCLNVLASSYYPLELKQMIEQGSSSRQDELRIKVHQTLKWFHYTTKDGEEFIAESCPANESCYRQISLTYSEAREFLFGLLHLEQDNQGYYINDVYCEESFHSSRINIGPMKIPKHDIINCEHTWPQSRFTNRYPKDVQKTDLHHLFPTDSKANGVRGNFPFGEVEKSTNRSGLCQTSEFGYGAKSHELRFEPPVAHKGNVARAIFYFAMRYELSIDSEQEEALRKWHQQDPVDNEEIKRNDEIYKIQKNRNPFVDFPELVGQITNF